MGGGYSVEGANLAVQRGCDGRTLFVLFTLLYLPLFGYYDGMVIDLS